MKSFLLLSFILICRVYSLPQPQPKDCGHDILTGEARQEGDSWSPDGCNRCKCLSGGRPGCTRRVCVIEGGGTCSEGTIWEELFSGVISECSCVLGAPVCKLKVVSVKSCTDNEGGQRAIGSSWEQSCNTCHCTETGVAACTEKFCLPNPAPTPVQECRDEDGNSRQVGESWKQDCNTCRCTETGVPACTLRFCLDTGLTSSRDLASSSRINFPSEERVSRHTSSCIDSLGQQRSLGQVWAQECNTCRCLGGEQGVSCTKRFCAQFDNEEKASFLNLVEIGDQLPIQCQQEGVTRCRRVRTDSDFLHNLRSGANLDLLPGTGVTMTLKRDPEVTTSGSLAFALTLNDGGEATVVIGKSGSMFGSIKPITGSVHYSLESCGQECTVLLERDSGFFNQLLD